MQERKGRGAAPSVGGGEVCQERGAATAEEAGSGELPDSLDGVLSLGQHFPWPVEPHFGEVDLETAVWRESGSWIFLGLYGNHRALRVSRNYSFAITAYHLTLPEKTSMS